MATVADPTPRRGALVERTLALAFSAIWRNLLVMSGLALLVGIFPLVVAIIVLAALFGFAITTAQPLGAFEFFGVGVIGLMALSVVILVLTHATLTPAVVADSEGRKAQFAQSLHQSISMLIPLTGLALVMGTLVIVGLAIFLVPGIFLYVVWSVATPAMVEERLGISGAMRRSWELTEGERWKIFAIVLLLCVSYLVISAAAGFIAAIFVGLGDGAVTTPAIVAQGVLSLLGYLVIEIIWASTLAALYVELRRSKEGGSVAGLEQVFA